MWSNPPELQCLHGTPINQHCNQCGPKPVQLPGKKKMLRVVLRGAAQQVFWFDIPVPEDPNWTLPSFVLSIRAAGYLLNSEIYVPASEIQSVFLYDVDKPPEPAKGVIIQFPK